MLNLNYDMKAKKLILLSTSLGKLERNRPSNNWGAQNSRTEFVRLTASNNVHERIAQVIEHYGQYCFAHANLYARKIFIAYGCSCTRQTYSGTDPGFFNEECRYQSATKLYVIQLSF